MTNIVTALNEGVVSFTYTKSDGTSRKATGTTNSDLIPESKRSQTNRNTETSQQISYFDTEKQDWRSFNRSQLDESSVQTTQSSGQSATA